MPRLCFIQDKNWEILETSKSRVDQFRRTMPLISDLKNKAMRPRHWQQIQVSLFFSPYTNNYYIESYGQIKGLSSWETVDVD